MKATVKMSVKHTALLYYTEWGIAASPYLQDIKFKWSTYFPMFHCPASNTQVEQMFNMIFAE